MKSIETGLYKFLVTEQPSAIKQNVDLMYGDALSDRQWDYAISIKPSSYLRKHFFKNILFYSDLHSPFKPLPANQAYPLLEWGMNWVIAAHDYNHLIIHSSVLVKGDSAILFPASPGSGKSTLTTFLGLSGWQVFSDEMAIIDLQTLTVKPLFRPACIKNESIELVKEWFPDAVMTPACHDTTKGTVAHVKIHSWEQYCQFSPAEIRGVVFPEYKSNVELEIYTLSQLQVFESFTQHAFNYHVMAEAGFNAASNIVKNVKAFELKYNDLGFLSEFLEEEILAE